MRIRRRNAIPALTAAALLAFAGAAYANNVSSENFTFTPSKVSKTTFTNGKIFVHTHTNYTAPGDKAHGGFAKTVTLLFDSDFKFNPGTLPKCPGTFASSTTLKQAYAACGPNGGATKNALVGTGTASTAPASNFPGCVAAFNGQPSAGNPTIVLFTRVTLAPNGTANCANPGNNTTGNTSVTLKGTLTNAGVAGFAKKLTVPNIDTAPLPLDDFTTTVQRGNYVQGKCSHTPKTWKMRTTFAYSGTGEAADTVNATQACTNP